MLTTDYYLKMVIDFTEKHPYNGNSEQLVHKLSFNGVTMAAKTPDEIKEEVLTMYIEAEMSPPTIAAEVGLNVSTIYAILKEAEMPLQPRKSDIDWGKLIGEYLDPESTLPVAQLVEKYGTDATNLYKYLAKAGISPADRRSNKRHEGYDKKKAAIVKAYLHSDASVGEIAALFDTSVTQLYAALRWAGIKPGRGKTAQKLGANADTTNWEDLVNKLVTLRPRTVPLDVELINAEKEMFSRQGRTSSDVVEKKLEQLED